MGAFDGLRISMSGMDAQQRRLRVISSNLANVNTSSDGGGNAFRRKIALFAAAPLEQEGTNWPGNDPGLQKVVFQGTVEDESPLKQVYWPSHPDADEKDFVHFPNIDAVTEMVNMMDAIRAYEANITVFNSSKEMIKKALEIGR